MPTNKILKAVIELDPPESNSTGGMVVEIISQAGATENDFNMPTKYVGNSNYKLVSCDENCQVGWIYTDKTHQLISPTN